MIDLTRQPRYDPETERRFVVEGLWTGGVLGDWLRGQAERNGADPKDHQGQVGEAAGVTGRGAARSVHE